MTRECSIAGCDRKVNSRGWCTAHYQRWSKHGHPVAGPPFRKPRGAPALACAVPDCERAAHSRGWCDKHYRRWLNDGEPGEAGNRTPGAGRHGYPDDATMVHLMELHREFNAVAAAVGVRRESLRDYLAVRPELLAAMTALRAPKLTPEQAENNNRRAQREYQRRYRAERPDEARRKRRDHMNSYGPEYRHRWNHYNRLRRRGLTTPDELANEYALILRADPCCYCGAPMEHIDHIVPIAGHGTGEWDNLTAACASCNLRKSDRTLLTFMLATAA